MTVPSDEHERTLAFAEIALGQIKALHQPAVPRTYEVWYNYATGYNPSLNQKVNETLSTSGTLSDADIELIYTTFISPTRFVDEVGTVNAKLSGEIDQVMALVDSAVRAATRHDASLSDVTAKLGRATDRDTVRGIIESLVQTASDMKRDNRALEARLKSSKQEITQLQQNLETARNESLTDPLTTLANRKYFDESSGVSAGHGRDKRRVDQRSDRLFGRDQSVEVPEALDLLERCYFLCATATADDEFDSVARRP